MPLYCKNCPKARKKTYTGKEPSPKGFGYCASCGSYGQEMLGVDGRLWVIRQRLNGSLYWAVKNDTQPVRAAIGPRTESPVKKRRSPSKRKSPKRKSHSKRKSPKRKSPKRKSPSKPKKKKTR